MVGLGCIAGVGVHPSWHHDRVRILASKSEELTLKRWWSWSLFPSASAHETHLCRIRARRPRCVPDNREAGAGKEAEEEQQLELEWKLLTRRIGDSGIISSCLVGLLTGVAVVLFNYAVSCY